ncbi:MAG TPA: decaprenyl-phosphate phosphoribosyltransferase [Sedimentisphaerales bacterium]|nr:decaprenyl-phosphate phosphoribosyltransferase [Sedimentisphaerales bacterium]
MMELARPRHWIKNLVVLMPVVFGLQMYHAGSWLRAATATAAFCLASSFAYIVNDIKDRESDRAHPAKKDRPLASGRIGARAAVIEGVVLAAIALILAQSLSFLVTGIVSVYLLLQIFYTVSLKERVLVDVICIALGFVLRAAAGAVAIGVAISPWLFICIFTLCLFMGFCKRYSEIATMGEGVHAGSHRATLLEYTPELLTHLITLSAAIGVIGFLLYGLSERTVEQFGTNYFIYVLPVVVYGVCRFAMLSMKGAYSGPTDIILGDRAFQLTVFVWILAVLVIIRYGRGLAEWIERTFQQSF